MTLDAAGNAYTATMGIVPLDGLTNQVELVLSKFDAQGKAIFRFSLPGSGFFPSAVAVNGNQQLFVTGGALLGAIPIVNAPVFSKATDSTTGSTFVLALDAAGSRIVYSTVLSGENGSDVEASAMTFDASGNIYLGGSTNAHAFPLTPDAFQSAGPTTPIYFARSAFAFLTELSADGSKILYSTYLGAEDTVLTCPDCVYVFAVSSISGIQIARDGSVIVAGKTNAPKFPVTQGSYDTKCNCTDVFSRFFIATFKPDHTLVWSTFFGGSHSGGLFSLRVAPDQSIVLAGTTDSATFPVTAGTFQAILRADFHRGLGNVFVSRVNEAGTALLASTLLGGSEGEFLHGFEVDPQGTVWLSGITNSHDFPTLSNNALFGAGFVARLDSTLSTVTQSQLFPGNYVDASLALDASLNQVLFGSSGDILRLPTAGWQGPGVLAVLNAADVVPLGDVAPGEIVSIYGVGLAGAHITFDGIPAPILFTGANQINAVTPFGVAGTSTTMHVSNSAFTQDIEFNLRPSVPRLLASPPALIDGQDVVALNSDNTLNSMTNPAAAGSYVTVYAFGAGPYSSPLMDGEIAPVTPDFIILSCLALFDQLQTPVQYAGSAPGFVAGVTQVNIQLPAIFGPGIGYPTTPGSGHPHSLMLHVGDADSQTTVIWTLQ